VANVTRPRRACRLIIGAIGVIWVLQAGCWQESGNEPALEDAMPDADRSDRNNLDALEVTPIQIQSHTFQVWLATDPDTREKGLMQVSQDELAALPDGAERGMLFLFPLEQNLSFWMHNTITPLDIAYIRGDGQIVRTYTMAPLETRIYPSIEPARYALEVSAGTFSRLGIGAGDHVEIQDSVLKDVR